MLVSASQHGTRRLCLSPLDVDIVRMRNYREAVGVVLWIWFWVTQRIVKLQILQQGRCEDEQRVSGQRHPHTDPPPHPEGDPALVPDQPQPALRLLQEPLRSEHLCLGPHLRVLHEAPEVSKCQGIFRYDVLPDMNLLCHPGIDLDQSNRHRLAIY